MKKLADISAFERLQINANAGMVSDMAVFNAVSLVKARPEFMQLLRIVDGGRSAEAKRILQTIKSYGPIAMNACIDAFEAAKQRYAKNGGMLPASSIVETDKEIQRIYAFCKSKFAPAQQRTNDKT